MKLKKIKEKENNQPNNNNKKTNKQTKTKIHMQLLLSNQGKKYDKTDCWFLFFSEKE